VRCWLDTEARENGRVPEETRVRALPGSCAVCLFGWRNQDADDDPMFCLASGRMMPGALFDISKRRAASCPLVQEDSARITVTVCPLFAIG